MKSLKLIIFIFLIGFLQVKSQTRIYNFNTLPLTDSIRLNFTILPGTACSGWQILKGSDSTTLNPIYVYPGLCGNVSFSETYKYTDLSPNKSTPNFYQILIPPSDYSLVKRVDIATSFSNLLIYPQPIDNNLNIIINGQSNYYYEINIYDRFGRKRGFSSGDVVDKITVDVSGFNEGVYVFYIVKSGGGSYRGKFLKKPQE
ncbi:MAG TPA: T9SS type A sorting domain-containing protein [Bacteroidia bacterium]|jgi:hypothetical protein|nr:T9SS type A sorting domain-containing protein [Bacteroidia bacterium]